MSNWTPKQALSALASKFRRSDSDESSSYSSSDEPEESAPVSTLAMMDERRPEAWLGNFLVILELSVGSFSTIAGARQDEDLRARLMDIKQGAAAKDPLRLLDPARQADLKQSDWSAWWQAQAALTGYSYSALSLAMLGDKGALDDVAALHNQDNNQRLKKDAHYVLCYLLGKSWPSSKVTAADVARLQEG